MTYRRASYYGIGTDTTIRFVIINWLLLLILVYDLQTEYLHTALRAMLVAVIL